MTITDKHIEHAHLCARLEVAGAPAWRKWRKNAASRGLRFTIGSKTRRFWPKKPAPVPNSGLTCRIFLSRTTGIAMDVEEKSDTRLRALKQIAGEIVALHRPEGGGKCS